MAKTKSKLPQISWVDIDSIKEDPTNPRKISKVKFKQLVNRMRESPEFFPYNPIKITPDRLIKAGNMRHRAAKKLDYKEVPVVILEGLSDEKISEFVIIDNTQYGEYDWPKMDEAGYEFPTLEYWGVDIPVSRRIDTMGDGEEIELPQSVQLEPPKEYILIMAEPNSEEWEEIKELLQLQKVRRGGYKKGSQFDAIGLERVIWWKDFKSRYNADSDSK